MTNSSRRASTTPQDVKIEVDPSKEEALDVPEITFDEETIKREKKLLFKIDLFLLPTIWVVYLLSYMDRSNIGNARVAGMGDDLEIDDGRYYLAVVLFQVGYVLAEVPCNMILSVSRPSRFIPIIMVLWGTACSILAVCKTWQQLVGLRFLLGVAEAGFSPAVMFIISSWYRKREQSKRFVVFHSAGIASGAFGGILAGAITDGLDGAMGLAGWRWLFIIEGAVTVAFAAVVPFVLLDYPLTSKRLSSAERELAYARLRADGITSRNDSPEHQIGHLRALKIAYTNWRLVPLALGYMIVIGNMSMAYFYPIFTELLGYDKRDAQYMTAPIYGVALVIAITLCIIADRFSDYRAWFCVGVLAFFGTVFSALASSIFAPIPRYIFLCMINTAIWAANPLTLSYTSTVLGPVQPEVRAICLATINGCANLAQLYGTYILTASEAPEYSMGFIVYSVLFAVGACIYATAFFVYRKHPYPSVAAF